MQPSVSIIIPAWNEADNIADTLLSLHDLRNCEGKDKWNEIIVVDDGSEDHTFEQAEKWADLIIRHPKNLGKGASLDYGWRKAKNEIIVFLDADLGKTASLTSKLVAPIINAEMDMAIARFPKVNKKAGFGFVKKLAVNGIYWLSGYKTAAPLSGQRAMRKSLLESISLSDGFGIEVGLTIDAVKKGFQLCEVDIAYKHRETGRDWAGFKHRGKQFISVSRTLYHKWRDPVC
ncbi:glycosyltransferase family 2 protein [Chengkuizengella sediminis]|uniref:glycosyltransferase family 2 protein n=1 Tax=Chengkuizengella sediminis TaxID=1885917 RepID=UPI00138A4E58|nr:glycosyltransferase family 2 protein [Chengkuizengella sediminis]NDI34242.1 glycosyltransferase family 2 protein [Chengkuizengella sediminis]